MKTIALALFPLLLLACGSKDKDGGPPELDTSSPGRVSPFDTLQVDFNRPLAHFSDSNIRTDLPVSWKKVSDSRFLIYGADSIMSGQALFEAGEGYFLEFIDLEDVDGSVQTRAQSFSFRTHPIIDLEYPLDTAVGVDNNSGRNAERLADSLEFFQGTPLDSGLSVAGILTRRRFAAFRDELDYYALWLREGDSVQVDLSGFTSDLDLEFSGPQSAIGEIDEDYITVSSIQGLGAEKLNVRIDANRHIFGTTNMKEWKEYHIVVRYPDPTPASAVATPYVLRVQRLAKKNH